MGRVNTALLSHRAAFNCRVVLPARAHRGDNFCFALIALLYFIYRDVLSSRSGSPWTGMLPSHGKSAWLTHTYTHTAEGCGAEGSVGFFHRHECTQAPTQMQINSTPTATNSVNEKSLTLASKETREVERNNSVEEEAEVHRKIHPPLLIMPLYRTWFTWPIRMILENVTYRRVRMQPIRTR